MEVKNNILYFKENGEKKQIGFNKAGLPFLGFKFRNKWYYQHLGNRYSELLKLINNPN